jgi:hypothetical protein
MSEHNKSSEDSMMEAYYKMIGEAHIDNIIEELEKDKNDIDKMTVPKSLDNWLDSFERRRKKISNRKKWLKRTRKLSSRAAVFLVILIACMTVVTMSVDAFRIRFFNFFINEKENYTEIEKREDVSNQGVPDIEVENFFYLSYVPTGYSFKSYTTLGDSIVIQYSSDEETIIFNQSKGDANYQLDTEGAEIRVVPIGEGSGQLILKDDRIMLFWSINEESFLIQGEASEQEIIKMAENLKKNK